MFIEELPNVLPYYIEANEPVEVAGPPGIGKSETIDQIIRFNSERDGFQWGLCKVFIAGLSPVDMYGFLTPASTSFADWTGETHTMRVSDFTVPPWMMSTERKPMNAYRRGIVVFEEWDKGDPDTKKASAEPILNGSLGTHKLHSGIARVVLVNRSEDRSGSTKNFDFIINRRGQLSVTANMTGWIKWAMQNAVDPLFTSFAERHPAIVFANRVPDEQGPFTTPRSLVKCSRVLSRRKENGVIAVDETTEQIGTGYLGSAACAQLLAWLKVKTETPPWSAIVNHPDTTPIPDKADACLLTCHEVAHMVDAKTIEPAVTYMRRMPKEFAMTMAMAAIARLPRLVVAPAMTKWAKENRSLLNVLGGSR